MDSAEIQSLVDSGTLQKEDAVSSWLSEETDYSKPLTARDKENYQRFTKSIIGNLSQSSPLVALNEICEDIDAEYQKKYGQILILDIERMQNFSIYARKPYDSLVDKVFRKNIFQNKNKIPPRWDGMPKKGWITPDNWLLALNDTVRARVRVNYLDGLLQIHDKITSLQKPQELTSVLQARETGHYALHCYATQTISDLQLGIKVQCRIEIQFVSYLRAIISELTHKFYEERRLKSSENQLRSYFVWQSDEFLGASVGHMVQFIEGAIVRLRDSQKRGSDDKSD